MPHISIRFSRGVRVLHLSMTLGVLLQLVSEQLMEVPKPGETIQPMEALFLTLHEWNGFVVLGIAFFYLMYLANDGDEWKRLFPWLGVDGCKGLWREIRTDIPGWIQGRLRPPTEAHYLAGTVHGMSILLMIGLGSTGILIFMGLESSGEMSEDIRLLRNLHANLGTLMWIYLFGHAGMGLLHQLKGHHVLEQMFSLGADRPRP